jgi:Tol biopolymer transport system component
MTIASRISNSILVLIALSSSAQPQTPNKLTNGWHPAIAPDGKSIALIQEGHLKIFSTRGDFIRMVGSGNYDAQPAWSPDGRKIAYASYGRTSFKTGQFSIWIVNADGSDLHELVESSKPFGDRHPSWSPDGDKITWTHGNMLWVADSSGKNAHPLVNSSAAKSSHFWEFNATWSPDCATIAFLRCDNHLSEYQHDDYQLWLIDSSGAHERRLDFNWAQCVRWSRDSKWLYVSNTAAVSKFQINDSVEQPCYFFQFAEMGVMWFTLSADERYIVYDTSGPDVDPEVILDRFVDRIK